MRTGELNRRISILALSTTQDTLGAPVQSWSTAYTCWASIDIQGSQLLYSTAEFMEKVAYRITVRYTRSFVFKPNQRIIYTDAATGTVHTYEIQAITNDKQANRQVTLMAYELDGSA